MILRILWILRCFGANFNMSRITRFLCYFLGLKFSSVLFCTLFPSLGFPDPSLGIGLMMRRMSVLHQNSGGIGKSIPSALKISLDPRDFPRASPSGNLSGLGKSLGRRGWISQYLPRFDGARIQSCILLYIWLDSFLAPLIITLPKVGGRHCSGGN